MREALLSLEAVVPGVLEEAEGEMDKKPVIWRKDWDVDCSGENAHEIYLDECPHCHKYPMYRMNPFPYCGGEIEYVE